MAAGPRQKVVMNDKARDFLIYVEEMLGTRSLRLLILGLSKQLETISLELQEIKKMSDATQTAVDHVNAAVASLKSEVQADVAAVSAKMADLAAQIAALQAAGTGATPEQIAALETDATDIAAQVTTLHDALNPTPPAP
jgi:septal ring factor EnvC (AmiA/AmiB activator)